MYQDKNLQHPKMETISFFFKFPRTEHSPEWSPVGWGRVWRCCWPYEWDFCNIIVTIIIQFCIHFHSVPSLLVTFKYFLQMLSFSGLSVRKRSIIPSARPCFSDSRILRKGQTRPFVSILKLGSHRTLVVSKSTETIWNDEMGYSLRTAHSEFWCEFIWLNREQRSWIDIRLEERWWDGSLWHPNRWMTNLEVVPKWKDRDMPCGM